MKNTKVYFWCKASGEDTKFYTFITDKELSDFSGDMDEMLPSLGIIDELQNDSKYHMLDNWGVIKTEPTDNDIEYSYGDIPAYKQDDFLSDGEKLKYFDEEEKKLYQNNKELKYLKRYSDYSDLGSSDLNDLYIELSKKLNDISHKIKDAESKEKQEARIKKRAELLKSPKFTSESGWIDRTGKWWNVQGVDHEEVAIEKWGSMWNAERNNIRVSCTMFGTYVVFNFRDAVREPNNKQMETLKEWGEHFHFDYQVKKFEKQVAIWFK